MKALLQRVSHASVCVDNSIVGEIGPGILVLVAIEQADTEKTVQRMAEKISKYRMFSDTDGKMNLSVAQTGGEVLVVSQFTLAADTNKGLRPSFSRGAAPSVSETLYLQLAENIASQGINVATGRFGADMKVSLLNDGPVTFMLDM
ncbi:D-aminoacyl-tRNA deacylase [Thalassotalea mangrovi]|uniref:D-aminoacyl-tRNA deacylase n=1 Tax=Thalassotalea mangrovi TaxID=2572245 RepID=A0A4U1B3Q3_9GAMM|nr:D-aminoacyl-tRNA deacylase [Thalassotalea mangrovi]TKB43996.1 D-tyrosyl-tRNA(Tyr) deacylase [Thalassotalea mangrovi]